MADYRPAEVASGKIPSGQEQVTLTLVPTAKIIDEARAAHPGLHMVTFKHVVASRGEDQAWLVERGQRAVPFEGRQRIAEAVAAHLERALD